MSPPLPPVRPAMFTEMTPSRPSPLSMSKWALITAKDRDPSAPWSPSTLQRSVREVNQGQLFTDDMTATQILHESTSLNFAVNVFFVN